MYCILYVCVAQLKLLCHVIQTLRSLNAPLDFLSQWGKLTDRRFSLLVAWHRRPHKTSRPRKPESHARAPAFPADVIKLRDTFGAQLYSVVVSRVASSQNISEITLRSNGRHQFRLGGVEA